MILNNEVIKIIFKKLGFKKKILLGSGRFGIAFELEDNKVLKITKDLKEYEYAKKLLKKENKHITNIYKTYHFNYENTKYAIILKEKCILQYKYIDKFMSDFEEQIGTSISYLSSEFLFGGINKNEIKKIFKSIKNDLIVEWFDMLLELKSNKIYVKDFNPDNIGLKNNTYNLCIFDLGLGYWDKIKFNKEEEIEI